MSKKTLFVLVIVLLIVLAPYTILPPMMGSLVGRILQDQLGLQKTPQVEVESSPGLLMYAGSFSEARISVKGYELGGIPTKYVALDLDPFNLNLLESVTNRFAASPSSAAWTPRPTWTPTRCASASTT